ISFGECQTIQCLFCDYEISNKKVFSSITANERRSHVASAENWPLIPFRELVKLFRSLTLLAFYDHPLTRARLGFVPGGLRMASK
ncbi:MAG: hypothetical protein K2Q32_02750, partial [Alphaproteobacteria bacterium]|nr:hypothetical protein [Alphaproteobacteria bacterium]